MHSLEQCCEHLDNILILSRNHDFFAEPMFANFYLYFDGILILPMFADFYHQYFPDFYDFLVF